MAYSESSPEIAEIDQMFESFIAQWQINGASIALVKDGRLVYAKGFGYADKERAIKVNPQHLFRIASVSKLFTAVGIMKLIEEGKFTLQSKVFGAQGLLKQYNAYIADTLAYKIEVEHLLTHTAGWRNVLRTDPMFVPVLVAQIMKAPLPTDFETIIQYMLSQKGMFEPGTLYDYSNFGYCLLGKIIEQQTGKKYEQYMQENILKPLSIRRMCIGKNRYQDRFPAEVRYYDHPKAEKNLSIYQPNDSASRAYEGTNTEALGAAGGWIATPSDLLRLLTAIDGFATKPDLLKPETIARMVANQNPKDSTKQYLLGWKQVDEEKWWRTGSLSSTGISLTRRHDGISWAFVTNTGSWRGPFFSYEIEGVMRRAVAKIKKFPPYDLFTLAE
ncbi:MAG: beta-lactamase family protein [Microscillaceae bacterium]|jgi:CubicO group peptidase (beta-lactamase class C family)|nr:beta-lactamase family protein [Microscillaceae bacterium]